MQFLSWFFLQVFEQLTAKISSVWIQINFRRKNISKIRRNSNRPWENSSRKYQSYISSVLSIKKCIVKQLLKSVFSCYHKLSNLVSDEPLSNQALRFFFFDRPRQRMLQCVICLPNVYQQYNVFFYFFADTLKLLSSLTWTRITFWLSFMAAVKNAPSRMG